MKVLTIVLFLACLNEGSSTNTLQFSSRQNDNLCPKSQHCYCYLLQTNILNDKGNSTTNLWSYGSECSFVEELVSVNLPNNITNLSLKECKISYIDKETFDEQFFFLLELIKLINLSQLTYISKKAFSGLPILEEIFIFNTALRTPQGLTGIDKASANFFEIKVWNNRYLHKIPSRSFSRYVDHHFISFKDNQALKAVENLAFASTHVGTIDLSFNKNLWLLEERAFSMMRNSLSRLSIDRLTTLSITSTSVERLPTIGLEHLVRLEANDTPNLVMFPHADQLPALKEAFLTYSYHCCALTRKYGFGQLFVQNETKKKKLVECEGEGDTKKLIKRNVNNNLVLDDMNSSWWSYNLETYDPTYSDTASAYEVFMKQMYPDIYTSNEGSDDSTNRTPNLIFRQPFDKLGIIGKLCEVTDEGIKSQPSVYHSPIVCSPQPNLLNPCEDILGSMKLNALSWIIALFAFFGNFVVIIVSFVSWYGWLIGGQKLPSVSSYLILNLALADFFMAIYMLMLSVMSTVTTGRYYQYGVYWQTLGGCDIAGFLSIFSLELSAYTLSVVSAERWYAIKNAINLEKRLSLRRCTLIMIFGWLLSILLATFPLFGINTYKNSAICLPIATELQSDRVYIGVILSLYILEFLIVVMSYWSMWINVRIKNQNYFTSLKACVGKASKIFIPFNQFEKKKAVKVVTNLQKADLRTAKRMAILVFTDFFSFFPICLFTFFGFVGIPLVSMSTTKAILIFFFPFNSCCNPFIYAILTKSFRKDVRKLLLRLRCCIKPNISLFQHRPSAGQSSKNFTTNLSEKNNLQLIQFIISKKNKSSQQTNLIKDENILQSYFSTSSRKVSTLTTISTEGFRR